jgi:hypothetical protein
MFYLVLKVRESHPVMQALQQQHEELTKRYQEALSRDEYSKARRMDRLSKVSFFFLL